MQLETRIEILLCDSDVAVSAEVCGGVELELQLEGLVI